MFQKYLQEYLENFSTTLTFPEEIQVILEKMGDSFMDFSIKSLEKDLETQTKQNRYIREISIMKLKLSQEFQMKRLEKLENVENFMKQAIRLYFQSFSELDLEAKHLEKGERHFIDEFLVISADLLLVN